jgi:acetoin utilization protein AcuB
MRYLISHTTVRDVMRKDMVFVSPTDTVEHAIAKAQAAGVGSLLVIDKGKLVGICTTNNFFYKIVNPTLGIGESGIRVLVTGSSIGAETEKLVNCINKLGIEIKVIWAIPSGSGEQKDIILHLGTEEIDKVVKELEKMECSVTVLAR